VEKEGAEGGGGCGSFFLFVFKRDRDLLAAAPNTLCILTILPRQDTTPERQKGGASELQLFHFRYVVSEL